MQTLLHKLEQECIDVPKPWALSIMQEDINAHKPWVLDVYHTISTPPNCARAWTIIIGTFLMTVNTVEMKPTNQLCSILCMLLIENCSLTTFKLVVTVPYNGKCCGMCDCFSVLHQTIWLGLEHGAECCIPFDCYFSFVKHTATRSHALSLFCKPSRINAFRYSFSINAPFLWNTLPHDVMLSNSITSFRLRLNNHLT